MYSLGIAQPLKYLYSADLLDLQSAIDLTSTWKVRFIVLHKLFFQNEVQRVTNKLVLITDQFGIIQKPTKLNLFLFTVQ